MKALLLSVTLAMSLSGCASTPDSPDYMKYGQVYEIDVLENYGPKYKELQGFILEVVISVVSRGFDSTPITINSLALQRSAIEAQNKGCRAFSILDSDNSSYSTTNNFADLIPVITWHYSRKLRILLVEDENSDEVLELDNLYLVSKYLP